MVWKRVDFQRTVPFGIVENSSAFPFLLANYGSIGSILYCVAKLVFNDITKLQADVRSVGTYEDSSAALC